MNKYKEKILRNYPTPIYFCCPGGYRYEVIRIFTRDEDPTCIEVDVRNEDGDIGRYFVVGDWALDPPWIETYFRRFGALPSGNVIEALSTSN